MENTLDLLFLPSDITGQLLEELRKRPPEQPLYVKVGSTALWLTKAAVTGDYVDIAVTAALCAPEYAPYLISEDSELGRKVLDAARMVSNGQNLVCRVATDVVAGSFNLAGDAMHPLGDAMESAGQATRGVVRGAGCCIGGAAADAGGWLRSAGDAVGGIPGAAIAAGGTVLQAGGETARIAGEVAGGIAEATGNIAKEGTRITGEVLGGVGNAVSWLGSKLF